MQCSSRGYTFPGAQFRKIVQAYFGDDIYSTSTDHIVSFGKYTCMDVSKQA